MSAAVPNLVNNGDFSIPKPFSAANVETGSGYTISGWTVPTTGVQDWASTAMQIPGTIKQAVKLYLQGSSSISQTVATVPGTTYQLEWYAAGEPGGPAVIDLHVLWNSSVVASQSFTTTGYTLNKMNWALHKTIVTATSTSSTLEFADATPNNTSGIGPMVTGVTLAADARLYLPVAVNVTPTSKFIAVVRTGTNTPLTATGLTVKLYAKIKSVSYAPPDTELLASAPVTKGQATLRLHLAASLKGQTLPAYAILQGPGYIPVTVNLKMKVT